MNLGGRITSKTIASIVGLSILTSIGACSNNKAANPAPYGVQPIRTGSLLCDNSLKDYLQIPNYDRVLMVNACAGDDFSSLTRPYENVDLDDIKTWSGPNGYCEYSLRTRRDGESPTDYYYSAIFAYQQTRYNYIGYNSHSELDLDCIENQYSNIGNSDQYEFNKDAIFLYLRGRHLMESGCEFANAAVSYLKLAGRTRIPKSHEGEEIYTKRDQNFIVPEALYVAALVSLRCYKNREDYFSLSSEAILSGYNFARSESPIGL